MQGRLIVFEGVEGSGKTTQLGAIASWLKNKVSPVPVVVTQEPGGTELGSALRQLLLQKQTFPLHDRAELFLFAADRVQHVEEVLKPQLEQGSIILCDRYVESTIAYQGYGRGLSLDLIHQLNQLATVGLTSDLTLWLDVEIKIGLTRAKNRGVADRLEQAALTFHSSVQQGYRELAQAHPERIVPIDASGSQEAVTARIQEVLEQKLTEWYG
ncbi:MAG: dTMP kinase [Kastovskya adunca ATA6-11-RM4]|jgi:dTMP kinase|nr:dTMP kinase [Kastovskya adunca ATA6-11-RM4]